ncbi:MAG: TrkA family potassium uptake protein [Spirochaetaceae bacterium]|nr:MAG: TrkA family potassium uptake protein [Spirochaetaceae bacterium]
MKQFGLVGIGKFGRRILDELLKLDVEILILDKNPELIEQYKNQVADAYVADALNEETIQQTIPSDIDVVILDTVDNIDVSILVTHYLKKIGVREIVAVAGTDQHGEILSAVGATRVIFPNKEAALRIAPTLVSSTLFGYFPIAEDIAVAEIRSPERFIGMTLIESDIRNELGITVIAVRRALTDKFEFVSAAYTLSAEDSLLIVAPEEAISKLSHVRLGGASGDVETLMPHSGQQRRSEPPRRRKPRWSLFGMRG